MSAGAAVAVLTTLAVRCAGVCLTGTYVLDFGKAALRSAGQIWMQSAALATAFVVLNVALLAVLVDGFLTLTGFLLRRFEQ